MSIDWYSKDESIVIPPVQAIAVFLNYNDEISIVQKGDIGEDDTLIYFSVDQAEKVIADIQRCIDSSKASEG